MKKKNIYILLPAVLLIWGLIGYRVFSAVGPSKKNTDQLVSLTQFKPQQLQEAETFIINTNYRDPFLGTLAKKPSKSKKRTKVIPKKPITAFPKIIYKGVVAAKGKKEQVFIVNVDGQQFFFKRNNINKKVKLIRGDTKQVVLKFQGQQQTFGLKK